MLSKYSGNEKYNDCMHLLGNITSITELMQELHQCLRDNRLSILIYSKSIILMQKMSSKQYKFQNIYSNIMQVL